MPETDPNGVPRPLDEGRAGPAKNNSGIMVGEVKETQLNSSTGQEEYKTAFVKVYQDAGVIGVAMLTLLVLCVLMGFFNVRLLKMYTMLTESRDNLDAARTAALERISQSFGTFQFTMQAELLEVKKEMSEQYVKLERLTSDSERKLDLLRREEITLDKLTGRLDDIQRTISHSANKDRL